MDQNQNQAGYTTNSSPTNTTPVESPNKSNHVALTVSIIAVLILLTGGLLLSRSIQQAQDGETAITASPESLPMSDSPDALSQSDDLNTLEAEANATAVASSANFDYSFDPQN
ncbi:MAG: hypothetical protein ABI430_03120 [Candidatus Taylorbacteria bacterium]